jgi:hypothetical protein
MVGDPCGNGEADRLNVLLNVFQGVGNENSVVFEKSIGSEMRRQLKHLLNFGSRDQPILVSIEGDRFEGAVGKGTQVVL